MQVYILSKYNFSETIFLKIHITLAQRSGQFSNFMKNLSKAKMFFFILKFTFCQRQISGIFCMNYQIYSQFLPWIFFKSIENLNLEISDFHHESTGKNNIYSSKNKNY